MIRRVEKDNRIIFVISMKREIDLDALNLLAAAENKLLCPCAYQAVGRNHNLIYQLETYQSIKEFIEALNVEEQIMEEILVSTCESEAETSLLNENIDNQVLESEGETTILSQQTTAFMVNEFSECETTVLSDMAVPVVEESHASDGMHDLFLVRVSSGERIHINKPVYSIGKDINNMDYVLGNEAVAKGAAIYAKMLSEEGKQLDVKQTFKKKKLSRISTCSYGVAARLGADGEERICNIILKGTELCRD